MTVSPLDSVLDALRSFASEVKETTVQSHQIDFQPEDQLKQSVPKLLRRVGKTLGIAVSVYSESPVADIGRPDLAIAVNGLLVGYIELKAPGVGTTSRELRGRDKTQLQKFLTLPNLIYTDARDWTFYREGSRQSRNDLRLGDIDEMGDEDITEADAGKLLEILREFLHWQPIVPTSARALAELLAPLTRMLRDDVAEAIKQSREALSAIYEDWKRTLFPEATADEFADSYAQTLTYGLLLAKLSGATTLDTVSAAKAIQHHSSLLARTLEILTQQGTRDELGPGLQLLERVIEAVDPLSIQSKDDEDPWLYFYEDFLAVYDPKLRNERGVYYTPVPVVKAQVTLVDELLRTKLNRPLGFADSGVTVLDPATGTGTYLLRVLQQGVETATGRFGIGAKGGIASQMAGNLYGFELLVGPYAVAHLRLSQAIAEAGGRSPKEGVQVYLTDTLESPHELGKAPHSFYEAPLVEEHRKARDVKRDTPIIICIGNPPYDRERRESPGSKTAGHWIRFGDALASGAPIDSFIKPAQAAGAGLHIKNLYNLYVYFWRWALWKVFENQSGPGIVSFITPSSYLRGPGFVGMREEMRRTFDDLWIIDLEGDNHGTRKTENVFDIQIPVAIAVGVRYGASNRNQPAAVYYAKITGSRADKFAILTELTRFSEVSWEEGQSGWGQPLTALSAGDYFSWPRMLDLMPWAQSGVKIGRTWVCGEQQSLLDIRLDRLVTTPNSKKALLFKNSPTGRKVGDIVKTRLRDEPNLARVDLAKSRNYFASAVRYGFRSFDRAWIVADNRLIDRPSPSLWSITSDKQVFLTSLQEHPLSDGPAIVTSNNVPDLHHYRGSFGGKDVIPLYRDTAASDPNVTEGLLESLGDGFGRVVSPEDLACYIVGVMAHTSYTSRFSDELEVPGPRVPLTKDASLFKRAVELGRQVIAWQTYAERFPDAINTQRGVIPAGRANLIQEIPYASEHYPVNLHEDVWYDEGTRELHVGGGVIGFVDPAVWIYEVSGFRVVRSWLGYRMRERFGRKSSPLDEIRPDHWTWEMTNELLELLWVLEGIIALEPAQDTLLAEIVSRDLFLASELPAPTAAETRAPDTTFSRQPRLISDDFEI